MCSSPNIQVKSDDDRGAVFPLKLHRILDEAEVDGSQTIVSWLPDNKSFRVLKKEKLIFQVLPRYGIYQKHYKSFQRQLAAWGFVRITSGPFKGGYSHEFFKRGKPSLCVLMKRQKVKGLYKRGLSRRNLKNQPCNEVRVSKVLPTSSMEYGGKPVLSNLLLDIPTHLSALDTRLSCSQQVYDSPVSGNILVGTSSSPSFVSEKFHFRRFDESMHRLNQLHPCEPKPDIQEVSCRRQQEAFAGPQHGSDPLHIVPSKSIESVLDGLDKVDLDSIFD